MATNTTTYSFLKPTVGGDTNLWGGYLNTNFDDIDDLLDGTTPVTGIDINSGSIDGTPIGASSASTGAFTTIAASGDVAFDTNGFFFDQSTGFAGIGTASPQDELHLVGTNPRVRLDDGTNTAGIGEDGFGNLILDADTGNVAGSSLIQFKIDNSEVARLTSTGRLGIGTTAPQVELHITSTAPSLRLDDGTAYSYLQHSNGDGSLTIASDEGNLLAASEIRFRVDGSEKARLTDTGRLGVGETSPSAELHITADNPAIWLDDNAGGTAETFSIASNAGRLLFTNESTALLAYDLRDNNHIFYISGTEAVRINTAGRLGVGGSASYSLDVQDTDGARIPVGTTAQRPTGANGVLRYNTTLGAFEGYSGGTWGALGGGGYFQGENGNVGTTATLGDIFRSHEQELNTDVTIAATSNSICAGPLTVASGTTLTISSGGNLVIA